MLGFIGLLVLTVGACYGAVMLHRETDAKHDAILNDFANKLKSGEVAERPTLSVRYQFQVSGSYRRRGVQCNFDSYPSRSNPHWGSTFQIQVSHRLDDADLEDIRHRVSGQLKPRPRPGMFRKDAPPELRKVSFEQGTLVIELRHIKFESEALFQDLKVLMDCLEQVLGPLKS